MYAYIDGIFPAEAELPHCTPLEDGTLLALGPHIWCCHILRCMEQAVISAVMLFLLGKADAWTPSVQVHHAGRADSRQFAT